MNGISLSASEKNEWWVLRQIKFMICILVIGGVVMDLDQLSIYIILKVMNLLIKNCGYANEWSIYHMLDEPSNERSTPTHQKCMQKDLIHLLTIEF